MLKFLILLTYYNRPKLIQNALESIKRLNYDNWELSIIDDISEVNIHQMCENYLAKRINYYLVEDTVEEKLKRGSIHGKYLNLAIEQSDADIVIPLCDDDALLSDYLSGLEQYFIENINIKYAYSNCITFDPLRENPFDIFTRRTDFGYHCNVSKVPSGVLDASQVVFRMECFKKDGIKYPYPQTRDLDAKVFQQAYEKYGECPCTGLFGQYKALFEGQLGFRKNIYNYTS